MSSKRTLPRLIVVTLHKSGTHLALRLVQELGYERRYFDPEDAARSQSSSAEAFLSSLADNAAYFLHGCPIREFSRPLMDHWRERGGLYFLYQYRDPRAVLLSQVNYLRRQHVRKTFSNTAYHLLFADVLQAQPSEEAALTVALQCMHEYLLGSFLDSVWMLHHPRVLSLSFEGLVGARGGGEDSDQLETVKRTLSYLGLTGDVEAIASRLYDASQPTFHRGEAARWRSVYTPEQLRIFDQRYGHLLDVYGYPRS